MRAEAGDCWTVVGALRGTTLGCVRKIGGHAAPWPDAGCIAGVLASPIQWSLVFDYRTRQMSLRMLRARQLCGWRVTC